MQVNIFRIELEENLWEELEVRKNFRIGALGRIARTTMNILYEVGQISLFQK